MGLKKKKAAEDRSGGDGAVKIPQHKHCHSCGKAVPPDRQHCSDECKAQFDGMVRQRKMLAYMIYAMVAIMIAAVVLGSI